MLLKWCDASSGIATFSGIEFVCCPDKLIDQEQQSKQQLDNQQIINYFEDEDIDDDDNDVNYDDDDDDENTDPNNQDDYNAITREDITNQISQDDIADVIKGFDVRLEETSDLEAAEGTQDQKKQYEKQKQLIINSIQASFNAVN